MVDADLVEDARQHLEVLVHRARTTPTSRLLCFSGEGLCDQQERECESLETASDRQGSDPAFSAFTRFLACATCSSSSREARPMKAEYSATASVFFPAPSSVRASA